jgi:FkbM family methyltransferase
MRIANRHLPEGDMLVRVAYRGREFRLQCRRYSTDRSVIQQCFEEAQYDLPGGEHGAFIDQVYEDILASGKKPLIVDCGANIGASVAWFIARYPKAHILAFEPAPDNFRLLKINCAGADVDLRQAGIGAADGRAFLSEPDSAGYGEWGYQVSAEATGAGIDLLSLRTALAEKDDAVYAPFLLKLDIEGSERALFTPDPATFDRFPLIVMEPHDWMFPGELVAQDFLRFHLAAGRELCMKNENLASIMPGTPARKLSA